MTAEDEIRALIRAWLDSELPDDATPEQIRRTVGFAVSDLRAEITVQGQQLIDELIAEAEEARE